MSAGNASVTVQRLLAAIQSTEARRDAELYRREEIAKNLGEIDGHLARLRAELVEPLRQLQLDLDIEPATAANPAPGESYCLLDQDGDWWFTNEAGDWFYIAECDVRARRARTDRGRGLAGAESIIDTYGVQA